MREKVEKLIRQWQEILHLNDWQIEVQVRNRPSKRGAIVFPDFRYRKATITVYNHHLFVEEYILHELLHLVVGDFTNLLSLLAENKLSNQEKQLLLFSEDQLVEKLTNILLEVRNRAGATEKEDR
jgi:hypothetical protein